MNFKKEEERIPNYINSKFRLYRELYWIFYSKPYRKRIWKRMYICLAQLLCWTAEINTTLYNSYHACAHSVVFDSFFNLMNYSPPASSVHGILQARTLEWVAMPSSWASPQPGGWTLLSFVSCVFWIGRQILYLWATIETQINYTFKK